MKSTPEMQCHAQYRCPSLKLSTDINYCQFKNTIHKINILLFCSRQQWRYNWTTDIRSNSLVELLWTLMQPTPLPTYVHDWWWLDRVWGEVFRIYRAAGSGHVRAGDIVGFYYPYQPGFWLGCAGANCAKSDCPGSPTTAHGFASEDHWVRCWGEVFRIYANGKSSGTVINSGDDIMLYYIQGDTWVSQGDGNTRKLPYPGSVRPPAFDKFDGCGWETFKIWKR